VPPGPRLRTDRSHAAPCRWCGLATAPHDPSGPASAHPPSSPHPSPSPHPSASPHPSPSALPKPWGRPSASPRRSSSAALAPLPTSASRRQVDVGRAPLECTRRPRKPDGKRPKTTKGPLSGPFRSEKSGGVLLSRGVSSQVPSALVGLTSVFGMGTGVTPPPWPPETCSQRGASAPSLEDSIASTNDFVDPSPRPISTGRLNTLPCVHLRPINVVVWPQALPG
jgi:hypothetical protein